MKATLLLMFIAFTASVTFCQSTEDENIKKVVSTETNSYYNRNYDSWQSTWLHSPKISATYVANGIYNTVSGWDSLSAGMSRGMKSNTNSNNTNNTFPDIKTDNFNITSDGNMAWVQYNQKITYAGTDSNTTRLSHEYRALVKDNNEWKILSMIAHDPETFTSTNSPQDIENSLNITGYNLINANRLNDAIEVFRLNVKLHPNAFNPYDSLGEALALAGKKKEAIENYEKSIKLNPKNENGVKMLEKLRAK